MSQLELPGTRYASTDWYEEDAPNDHPASLVYEAQVRAYERAKRLRREAEAAALKKRGRR